MLKKILLVFVSIHFILDFQFAPSHLLGFCVHGTSILIWCNKRSMIQPSKSKDVSNTNKTRIFKRFMYLYWRRSTRCYLEQVDCRNTSRTIYIHIDEVLANFGRVLTLQTLVFPCPEWSWRVWLGTTWSTPGCSADCIVLLSVSWS